MAQKEKNEMRMVTRSEVAKRGERTFSQLFSQAVAEEDRPAWMDPQPGPVERAGERPNCAEAYGGEQ